MIEIKAIDVYRGKTKALSQFTHTFPATGGTILQGANGAGKSTLLRAIAGELPLSSGEILINGMPTAEMKPAAQAKLRGVVPQKRTFVFNHSVGDLLNMATQFVPRSPHADWIEAKLEIDPSQKVLELSQGQQDRVSLAMGLTVDTPYYLLDEPTAAQDVVFEASIAEILAELAKERGVLIAAHGESVLSEAFPERCELFATNLNI